SLPLQKIVGDEEFKWLQDTWAKGRRNRWSVAFPIVESYEIVGRPKAKDVLPSAVFERVFHNQSATLRPLDEAARAAIAGLEIRRLVAPNAEILVDQDIAAAEGSELDEKLLKDFDADLEGCWEGESEERRRQLRRRAVWLARNFAKSRESADTLHCDHCKFD